MNHRITTGVALMYMSTGFSGLTKAQSELIEHWRARHLYGGPPKREHLDPGAIKAHLSAISIIEIGTNGQAKFRLVGSKLRMIFGREMRGRYLAELDRDTFEMWSLGLSNVLDQGQPVGGMIERQTDSHVWLRLPLQSDREGALVLCHDCLLPNARFGDQRRGQSGKFTRSFGDLAA